jgi:hypothetical protein
MSLDQRQPGWHSMRAMTVLPTVTIRFATLGPDTISSGWSIDPVLITPIQIPSSGAATHPATTFLITASRTRKF